MNTVEVIEESSRGIARAFLLQRPWFGHPPKWCGVMVGDWYCRSLRGHGETHDLVPYGLCRGEETLVEVRRNP